MKPRSSKKRDPENRYHYLELWLDATRLPFGDAPNGCPYCAVAMALICRPMHCPPVGLAMARNRPIKVCAICSAADTLMAICSALSWDMARIAVHNEYEENVRLPAGLGLGVFKLGADVNMEEPEISTSLWHPDELIPERDR